MKFFGAQLAVARVSVLIGVLLVTALAVSPRHVRTAVLLTLAFAALYVLTWYLPNRSFFNQVLAFEGKDKFLQPGYLPHTILSNIRLNLFGPSTRYFMVLAFISFIAGCLYFIRSSDQEFKILFVISCVWILLEGHRLFFTYFPPRYQVSLFFAVGFNSSVVVHSILVSADKIPLMKSLSMTILLFFLSLNGYSYAKQLAGRQFTVAAANKYMVTAIKDSSAVVLGSWAPGISWDSRSRAVPVWKNFLNDEKTMEQFQPIAIVTEPDEADSRGAFRKQGMELKEISDSLRTLEVGPWHLIVYWVKPR
jgi:hypothetical protein